MVKNKILFFLFLEVVCFGIQDLYSMRSNYGLSEDKAFMLAIMRSKFQDCKERCPSCGEKYERDQLINMFVECGHCFCSGCAKRLRDFRFNNSLLKNLEFFTCPVKACGKQVNFELMDTVMYGWVEGLDEEVFKKKLEIKRLRKELEWKREQVLLRMREENERLQEKLQQEQQAREGLEQERLEELNKYEDFNIRMTKELEEVKFKNEWFRNRVEEKEEELRREKRRKRKRDKRLKEERLRNEKLMEESRLAEMQLRRERARREKESRELEQGYTLGEFCLERKCSCSCPTWRSSCCGGAKYRDDTRVGVFRECGHSMCYACLLRMEDGYIVTQRYECPICGKYTERDDMNIDFYGNLKVSKRLAAYFKKERAKQVRRREEVEREDQERQEREDRERELEKQRRKKKKKKNILLQTGKLVSDVFDGLTDRPRFDPNKGDCAIM